jgi:lysophospholipase L1-like esterase
MSRVLNISAAGAASTLALALAMFCAAPAAAAAAAQEGPLCSAPPGVDALEHPPVRIRERITRGLPIKIVAIGSSSTYGAGASSAAASYPSRLEAELKARLPGLPVTVLNKGIGGEEAGQMVARFDADVLDESPDLVVWQVGSNSVLLNHPVPGTIIHQGVERLKASGTEVVLMNPQYAPKIIVRGDVAQQSVDVITATARDEQVGLFDRFTTMRYWYESEKLPFEQFLTADGVHMNDWGYACIARLMASAIADGARPPAATATVTPDLIKR